MVHMADTESYSLRVVMSAEMRELLERLRRDRGDRSWAHTIRSLTVEDSRRRGLLGPGDADPTNKPSDEE